MYTVASVIGQAFFPPHSHSYHPEPSHIGGVVSVLLPLHHEQPGHFSLATSTYQVHARRVPALILAGSRTPWARSAGPGTP